MIKNYEVVKANEVEVFIDLDRIMFLPYTNMDYKKDKFSSFFGLNNSNKTKSFGCCGCIKI